VKDVPAAALEDRVEILTPEMVRVSLPLAGIGRRGLAFLVDFSIRYGIPFLVLAVLSVLAGPFLVDLWMGGAFKIVAMIVAFFSAQFLYHLLFEALWAGQTPGKRLLGIRVVEERGRQVTIVSSAVRNLLRMVDALPFFYGLGVFNLFVSRRHQRLGDVAAGTLVVREDRIAKALQGGEAAGEPTPAWIARRRLRPSYEEWDRIRRFLARAPAMEEESRRLLEEKLLRRALQGAGAEAPDGLQDVPPPPVALRDLAGRPPPMGLPSRRSRRFLERRGEEWRQLDDLLRRAGQRGLRALPADDLKMMGRLYRRAASDLAFVRTHLPGSGLEGALNALVLRGHNLVYQGERTGLPQLLNLYRRDVPRAFRASLGPILLAATIFLLSAFGSFVLASLRPDIAEALVGRELLDRYVRQERLWVDDFFNVVPGSLATTAIATNNIIVTFAAFALGITLGLGTVYILVLNGVHLGSVFAVCSAYGLGGELSVFIMAHGLVEIACILIAGGAGLVLGGALINPGDLRRREALVVRGRQAVVLVLGTAPALVVTGLVETFISPSAVLPWWSKAAVGVGLLALMLAWLLGGDEEEGGKREPVPVAWEVR